MGSVLVTGVATVVSASSLPPQVVPATPTLDFSPIPVSLTFEEGVTTGLLNISLPDNSLTSPLKVFQFSLTSVVATSPLSSSLLASPRLSTINITTSVTIVDDEGGAGQFQLTPTALTIAEGSTMTFSVLRSGGASGRVSLLVQTVESGTAISGEDYQPFSEELVFDNGVSQLLMSVSIVDDAVPEGPEDFSVSLSAPSGAALVDTSAVSGAYYRNIC